MSLALQGRPPQRLGREQYYVGCRYWRIDHQDRLIAPLRSGKEWAPGLNHARCDEGPGMQGSCREDCTCGLYGVHYGPTLTNGGYFNLDKGIMSGLVVGGIAYWNPATPASQEGAYIRAEYAAVACLIDTPIYSQVEKTQRARVAEQYGLEVVARKQVAAAVAAYVERQRSNWFPPEEPVVIGDWSQGPLWGARRERSRWKPSERVRALIRRPL